MLTSHAVARTLAAFLLVAGWLCGAAPAGAASAERAQAVAERARSAQAAEDALQAEQAAAAAARRAEAERLTAERQARDAESAERMRALAAATLREQEAAEAAHEARMKQLRAECGADFQTPRVGMPLARAQRCVGDLALVSQRQRADGVASVYRAGPLFVTVLHGAVVAWANTAPAPR